MSKIAVINPNLSEGFTRKVGDQARSIVGANTDIIALNPQFGPASIEGYYDEAFASVGLLSVIRDLEAAPDHIANPIGGYVVACFDDTGVDAARCLTSAPVLGLCEGALRMAAAVASRFAIVTPMPVSVRPLEHLVAKYGAASQCVVRAAGVRTLDFEGDGADAAYQALKKQAKASLTEDRSEAIVLGCAGMTDIADRLKDELGVPVIDGVSAAVKMIEAMAMLGLHTSKVGAYASPPLKTYHGMFSGFAPQG
ncbi:aspartate/glutamate racemase family protein [Thalassospira lucentensis]|uniref:aspartate/glutamate racemase family protein n=1 Tax=Thalassospira lucentensis TaxID=168935 RepID=UPI0003B6B734|nr:aspartate/glutamate racemase family protein [Thalassospira lucentensis]RCK29019.1 Asp/Glu/hydantoin racemase [Thalassospira lucentensis MCCC 1A00383 = DSM 14000]